MKPISPLGTHFQSLATAGLLAWASQIQAATPYHEETHGPRVGTRILHFFRDLAYGENPNDRYRNLPRNRPPQQYQQRPQAYVPPPPGGNRYNLDSPPPAAYARSQPQQEPAPRNVPQQGPQAQQPAPYPSPATPHTQPDMPYPSPASEPPSGVERDDSQAGIGEQREALPPVTIKPKSGASAKPATAPTKPAPDAGALPPPLPPVKPEANQLASNTTAASKKSWQTNQNTETSFQTPPAVPPPVQSPASTPSPPASSNSTTTLTGSRTSKEGRVKSPYPPYNELDVSGLPAGSLAMDPTTGKVFRVP